MFRLIYPPAEHTAGFFYVQTRIKSGSCGCNSMYAPAFMPYYLRYRVSPYSTVFCRAPRRDREQKIDLRRFLLNLPRLTERSQCFFSAAAHFAMGSDQVPNSDEVSVCRSSGATRTSVIFFLYIHYFSISHRISQICRRIWKAPGVMLSPSPLQPSQNQINAVISPRKDERQ